MYVCVCVRVSECDCTDVPRVVILHMVTGNTSLCSAHKGDLRTSKLKRLMGSTCTGVVCGPSVVSSREIAPESRQSSTAFFSLDTNTWQSMPSAMAVEEQTNSHRRDILNVDNVKFITLPT